MIQQINLYQPTPRPVPAGVSFAAILRVTLVAVLALGGFYGYLFWHTRPLEARWQELTRHRQTLEERMTDLATELENRQADPVLFETLQARQGEQALKARLLEVLADGGLGRTEGFGDYMAGLARQRVEGLWLTGLTLREGGRQLTLTGRSLSPERVPRLLTRLGQEPVFQGRAFRALEISQPREGGELSFTLSDGPGVPPP